MFIRRTKTRSAQGHDYFTFRLVESVRIGDKVRQRTLLNLGSDFSLPKSQWGELVGAIDAVRSPNNSLLQFAPDIASLAENIASQLPLPQSCEQHSQDWHGIDINSINHTQVRSVGLETVALHALEQLKIEPLLESLGIGTRRRKLAMAQIAARMVHPASELESFRWLTQDSALCELMQLPLSQLRLGSLYRAADLLFRHRSAIENALYQRQCELFSHSCTVLLYDLTNTWFCGAAHISPGQFGRSKQKRHDCPLVSLGLCLDSAGFVRRSEVLPGNVSEPATLQAAVQRLGADAGELTVVMDAGITSQENLDWLTKQGYDWVVVDRSRPTLPQSPPDLVTQTRQNNTVRVWRSADEGSDEVRLFIHSETRERTENSMLTAPRQRFEDALENLRQGLCVPKRLKRYERVLQKIGRLREQYKRVSSHYDIEVKADAKHRNAIDICWSRNSRHEQRDENAGAYLLRSSLCEWQDEQIVRMYWTLSDVEATFRSLKSELGLRPIYHQKKRRVAAHLLISVLAYQAVHALRMKMRTNAERGSWQQIRRRLTTISRLTTVMHEADGSTLRVRHNTAPNAQQLQLLKAMEVKVNRDQRKGKMI